MELGTLIRNEANKLIKGVYSFDEKVEILLNANITTIPMNETNFYVWGLDKWNNSIKSVLSNVSFDLYHKELIGNHCQTCIWNDYCEDYAEMHQIRKHTIEKYVDAQFILLMQQVDNSKVAAYVTLISESFLDNLKKEKELAIVESSKIDDDLTIINSKISELKYLLAKTEKDKATLVQAKSELSFDTIVKDITTKFCTPFDESNSKIIKYFITNMMNLTGWFK